MRRSVSASRGNNSSSAMTSSYHSAAKLVKKSRPTQTSLTKDACHEAPDTGNPGLVNFQVGDGGMIRSSINLALVFIVPLHLSTTITFWRGFTFPHIKLLFMLNLNRMFCLVLFPRVVKAYLLHPRCSLGLAARTAR